jgi:hypothetical protein
VVRLADGWFISLLIIKEGQVAVWVVPTSVRYVPVCSYVPYVLFILFL